MADSIHDLTSAMAAGEKEAVESFYRRYFDWLYLQARRAARRDEAFCLDVVQDAVVRIIRNVRAVKSEAQLRAWLKLVVQTTAFDHLRTLQRKEKHELAVATIGAVESTDEMVDEQYEWLKRQIAQLDPQIVRMIELRFEQSWTLNRIGKLLGLSVGTVDGRLRRTLKELRSRAVEKFDDDV